MFIVYQLEKPIEIQTPFGTLFATHGKRYVEHIDPTDVSPILIKSLFGVFHDGAFLLCPFAQPVIEALDQKGYQDLLATRGGDLLVSEIPAAIAKRAAEIQAEIDAKKNWPVEIDPIPDTEPAIIIKEDTLETENP